MNFQPALLAALSTIVLKKPFFTSLAVAGLTGLAHTDISTLRTDTKQLESILVAKIPVSKPACNYYPT